ncbi:MAG: Double zinc ribbon [Myxococcales bacterium]|jgi:RNA polymerase subunit RPABC4/transcription elongation factor Spt4|nr:Double zinc ribbon [Myxococcales bacterium]
MQAIQFVLFLVVAALALVVFVVVVRRRWPGTRAGQAARPSEKGVRQAKKPVATPARAVPVAPVAATVATEFGQLCPACGKQFPAGLRYCPHDARALVPAGGAAVAESAAGTQCPRCARLYGADKRFCPFDAEELVAIAQASASASISAQHRIPVHRTSRGSGKICPHCAQHYEADATLCGRDGAALVSVN